MAASIAIRLGVAYSSSYVLLLLHNNLLAREIERERKKERERERERERKVLRILQNTQGLVNLDIGYFFFYSASGKIDKKDDCRQSSGL